jgi:hypothetical protein
VKQFLRWWSTKDGASLIRAAARVSESELSDDKAVKWLEREITQQGGNTRAALRHLGERRDRFDMDRAYRLLSAAVTGEPVEPLPGDRRDLFEQERRLGRMALEDAFGLLAARAPQLCELADITATQQAAGTGNKTSQPSVSMILYDDSDEEICRSNLAVSIATQYLDIVHGRSSGDVRRSYFSQPRKMVILVTRFHTNSQ